MEQSVSGSVTWTPESAQIMRLAEQAVRAARGGQLATGIALGREAHRRAVLLDAPDIRLKTLTTLAQCQAAQGNYIQAVAAAMDGYDLARQLNDSRGVADVLVTIAGANSIALGTLEESLSILNFCRAAACRARDLDLEVRALNLSGVVLGNLKRFDDADNCLRSAMKIASDNHCITPASLVAGNLAGLLVKRARTVGAFAFIEVCATAEKITQQALAMGEREGNSLTQARMMFNLGDLCMLRHDVDNASRNYRAALLLASASGNKPLAIYALTAVAAIEAGEGRFDIAIEKLQRAFEHADADRPTTLTADIGAELAAIHDKLGNCADAQYWRELRRKEVAQYERESANARRQLQIFWAQVCKPEFAEATEVFA